MSDNYDVGERADELDDDPTQINVDDQPAEDDLLNNEEDQTDWQAEAQKWKQTAENYKLENQKYRSKRVDEVKADKPQADTAKPAEATGDVKDIERDYTSKKADVIDEFREEINDLQDPEWEKIKNIINPRLMAVRDRAVREGRYTARGELQRSLSELIEFAKSTRTLETSTEEARVEGLVEGTVAKNAEIPTSGAKPTRKNAPGVTQADIERAKSTGRTPDEEKQIREKKEEVAQRYAVNRPLDKYLP